MKAVPPELESLAAELLRLGFKAQSCEHGQGFGNYLVSFASIDRSFSIVRDRGRFHVECDERAELEQAGLWRSFTALNSLSAPLIAWLSLHNAA
jgi:hypothetical protein